MSQAAGTWSRGWAIAAIVGGIALLIELEIIEEPGWAGPVVRDLPTLPSASRWGPAPGHPTR